ncbi:MAG TPA: HAD-IB family hydrolase [Dehalococcoidales bacterium]|nr:HAD-IB family hydrolase [Dehalococcoidales bacterium]
MATEKIVLAIFDFDGTLTTGHLWKGLAAFHNTRRIKRTVIYGYILKNIVPWLAAKIKLYPKDKNLISWGTGLAKLVKGFTEAEVKETFEWVADNYFQPLLRQDMLEVMQQHRRQGHRIMLLSGSFFEFLEIMAKKLEMEFVVGTSLEKRDGLYTGKIVPPLCFAENKANYLLGFTRHNSLNVDFNQSYVYADSIYDSALFRLVGHPVAVYPDQALFTQAQRQGWSIIGEAKGK